MKVLTDAAALHSVKVIYTNQVGSYDGYDGEVVFDGKSVVLNENGEVIYQLPAFKEELALVDLEQDLPVVPPSSEKADIVELHDALVLGIKEFFRRKNCTTAYIGLSGGIDSAVVAALACDALGAENVIGVTMPSHVTGNDTKSDAYLLAQRLGMRCIERPITSTYDAWLEEFKRTHDGTIPQSITKQNMQARIRQTILMEYTNEDRGSLLLNTGNKTEVALGYFTLYGDAAGAISVLGDVDKLQVYALARFINRVAQAERIPQTTIDRAPTAELEAGQTDANSLPADYDILVPLVNDIVEHELPHEELVGSYQPEVVDKTLRLIRIGEGKRRQLPPAIRVTGRSFGIERRVPMDHTFSD